MAFKFSTALRRYQATAGSLKSALDGSVMRFYSGPIPASSDAALSGNTLLLELKTSADGNLTFEPIAEGAVLKKSLSEIWRGDGVAAGNMSFFRLLKPGDMNGDSTDDIRVQGTVGGPAADITVSTTAIEVDEERVLEYFAIELREYV